jgi:sulfoxide reductase catalytic subunit YedY
MYLNRRRFLRQLGFAGGGMAAMLAGCGVEDGTSGAGGSGDGDIIPPGGDPEPGGIGGANDPTSQPVNDVPPPAGETGDPNTTPADNDQIPDDIKALYPAEANEAYRVDDRVHTAENIAGKYNNFYEFTTNKARVHELAQDFMPRPWEVEVRGRCNKPGTYAFDDLIRLVKDHMEERIYRFRCVEAWSMVVPWTGVPLSKLLDVFEPHGDAKYVRFLTVLRPEEMPGQKAQAWYDWPYYEGLRMDEAYNPLSLATFGIYGHPLPNQHGAPFRLTVPWKYGFKNIKSIVLIEFQDHQPPTFWNDLVPHEYDFLANVDPTKPHPRWTQAEERDIGQDGKKIPTLPFNGYADQVASMYEG